MRTYNQLKKSFIKACERLDIPLSKDQIGALELIIEEHGNRKPIKFNVLNPICEEFGSSPGTIVNAILHYNYTDADSHTIPTQQDAYELYSYAKDVLDVYGWSVSNFTKYCKEDNLTSGFGYKSLLALEQYLIKLKYVQPRKE